MLTAQHQYPNNRKESEKKGEEVEETKVATNLASLAADHPNTDQKEIKKCGTAAEDLRMIKIKSDAAVVDIGLAADHPNTNQKEIKKCGTAAEDLRMIKTKSDAVVVDIGPAATVTANDPAVCVGRIIGVVAVAAATRVRAGKEADQEIKTVIEMIEIN